MKSTYLLTPVVQIRRTHLQTEHELWAARGKKSETAYDNFPIIHNHQLGVDIYQFRDISGYHNQNWAIIL